MDLRSIVHAEDTPDARKLPAASLQSSPTETSQPPRTPYQPRGISGGSHENQALNGQDQHGSRPANPPPIRTVSYNDSSLRGGSPNATAKQNSYPATRSNIDQTGSYPYPERGSASSSQGHQSFSTPLSHTPTGSSPGSAGAYSTFQRPTSSHSGTPGSAQYHSSSLVQRSPQSSNAHARAPSQPSVPQHYPSQPHTPLGPPSGRPSYNISHEFSGPYSHQRTHSSGSYSQQYPVDPVPNLSRPPPSERLLSAESRGREHSQSVSPKTKIDVLPAAQSLDATRQRVQGTKEQTAPVSRTMHTSLDQSDVSEQEIKPLTRRSTSTFAIGGLLNEAPANDKIVQTGSVPTPRQISSDREASPKGLQRHQPLVPQTTAPPLNANHQNSHSVPALAPNSRTILEVDHQVAAMDGVLRDSQVQPSNMGFRDENLRHHMPDHHMQDDSWSAIPSLKPQPARKKPRLEHKSAAQTSTPRFEVQNMLSGGERPNAASQAQRKQKRCRQVPKYAQSVREVALEVNGNSKLANKGQLPALHPTALSSTSTAPPAIQTSTQPPSEQETNNGLQSNGTHVPTAQPEREIGPLGAWEPSILDVEPTEDITKVISDWLFTEVVLKQGIGVGPPGGSASTGAVLEIEAKIGRLIDQNTNDRLRLPVASECVISQSDPNMRINFESSMTEAQHRAMNGFLNKAVQESMGRKVAPGVTLPSKKRIPLVYQHTYETDRFYELSQQGLLALPRAVTDHVEARHKRKTTVRITNDQKTGREIAKIVKARLADINVYSPRTLFDYRISVNVEMNFEGSMADLVEPDRARGRKPDRNKDRMSYTHLAYRIDLTQVTPTEGMNKAEKEHELEIEVSSEEVRRQGLLAMRGQDHDYDKLVKGFLDNVRILARRCMQ